MSAAGEVPARLYQMGNSYVYVVGPSTATNQAGDYTIEVTDVFVNGITYGTGA